MTGLYNLVAAVRDDTLPPARDAAAVRARARIVAKLHDDLDRAVADAYGWGDEWRAAPLPPAEIVARLVALNAQRASEEAQGQVRWLRPEYQAQRGLRGPARMTRASPAGGAQAPTDGAAQPRRPSVGNSHPPPCNVGNRKSPSHPTWLPGHAL
ncbi:hypothetical protein [uncultured Sphingomonas sp.]|uniref:hypothetical protein n=1 Tax=uncultured Sphingomonas sp. TaxID=158754 RepID=UPI0035CA7377